jgi:cobaltochelatase CobN
MHLLAVDARTLDEAEAAVDLGQTPADLVFLSFSDSDLGAAASAWQAMGPHRRSLRLVNLARLRHPMSVDLYLDRVVSSARAVIVRLLGAKEYWRYGTEEIFALCERQRIPLAMVPGDGVDAGDLAALSTVPAAALARLDALLREGGAVNVGRALALAAHLGGLGDDDHAPVMRLPPCGEHELQFEPGTDAAVAAIVFYRSHLLAGDIAPIEALAAALAERGLRPRAVFVPSLKDGVAAAFVSAALCAWQPVVVLNATGFSARRDSVASPLDAAGRPVLQVILSAARREAWEGSSRGASPSDLAMQVVLPELDGRLATTAISFKGDDDTLAELEYTRVVHRPDAAGVALAADRALAWATLARTPRALRRVAIVLSNYPGGGQRAHAVGLDTLASLDVILGVLASDGYGVQRGDAALVAAICDAEPSATVSLEQYCADFATLPPAFQARVIQAWGEPAADPDVADRIFRIRYASFGNVVVAVQPDRGVAAERRASYHDPDLPPRHAYIAFYLWLRRRRAIHAMVHLGTHGTLEWLPGKAVAPSADCAPSVLAGGLPVIYPFIVNNPGEAACAKRRLGAVTIGHLTPPLRTAGTHGAAVELERLLDEYAAADGLDRRRTSLLRDDILGRAASLGLAEEAGIAADAAPEEALVRLDAYLCDVKDLQVRDGLHVFGRTPEPAQLELLRTAMVRTSAGASSDDIAARLLACAHSERDALLAALDGRFVQPGPAGAPTRGRVDVLPTGRNLTAIDPRGVPTRSALVLAERLAADFLRRYRQDHGEWPRSLVLNVWGSSALRTGGEDLALAFLLLGARPLWDDGSARVTGVEILPLAVLDRPRVDVTLRISGLFRDAFEAQLTMFDAAVRAVAERDESPSDNPLSASLRGLSGEAARRARVRVFGTAPGVYGAGLESLLRTGAWDRRDALGEAFIAASSHGYADTSQGVADDAAFRTRIATADAFLLVQDHREVDVLDGDAFAAHAGGLAAAAASLGHAPALYHADTSEHGAPRTRAMKEEIARVARGRLANPVWIAGMMRHGYRGAAEIARGVEALAAFAATLPSRLDRQFDLAFEATLATPEVDAFLRSANPQARDAISRQLRAALDRDLWRPRRNAVVAMLAEMTP